MKSLVSLAGQLVRVLKPRTKIMIYFIKITLSITELGIILNWAIVIR